LLFSALSKRSILTLAAAAAVTIGAGSVASATIVSSAPAGPITIQVVPTLAPNVFGSPSFAPWQANAITALDTGTTTFGAGAAQFDALPNNATLDWRQAVVTGFESWRGVATPNAPSFSGEYGNRMHFALHILGNGTKFSIGDLSFNATSTDVNNSLAFGFAAGNYQYGAGYVGIDYGGDGVNGGGDDLYITSGANTQLVDELIARGSGNALDAYVTDPGATLQDRIDNSASLFGIDSDFSFTGTYTLGAATGSATVNYTVPEPAMAGSIGVAAIFMRNRKRRQV
jgi:hypothetical protein